MSTIQKNLLPVLLAANLAALSLLVGFSGQLTANTGPDYICDPEQHEACLCVHDIPLWPDGCYPTDVGNEHLCKEDSDCLET